MEPDTISIDQVLELAGKVRDVDYSSMIPDDEEEFYDSIDARVGRLQIDARSYCDAVYGGELGWDIKVRYFSDDYSRNRFAPARAEAFILLFDQTARGNAAGSEIGQRLASVYDALKAIADRKAVEAKQFARAARDAAGARADTEAREYLNLVLRGNT